MTWNVALKIPAFVPAAMAPPYVVASPSAKLQAIVGIVPVEFALVRNAARLEARAAERFRGVGLHRHSEGAAVGGDLRVDADRVAGREHRLSQAQTAQRQ